MNEQPGANLRFVSRKRRVREDKRFVTGTAVFAQDVNLPNMKHCAVVQSPYPRAKILSIDASLVRFQSRQARNQSRRPVTKAADP